MSERPFKIAVSNESLEALQQKLALTRLPDELDDVKWDYGVPLSDMKRLLARWKDSYDWRKYEAELNELPQFTRDIEVNGFGTLNVHYLHQRSTDANAIPLLFVHGWPGSFFEARKIIPQLTDVSPEYPTFHVVVLGLPGYGFSEAPHQKGFALAQYAELGHKLMEALGYAEYVTQGGDWGYVITRRMASLYGGTHVKAWHTNCTLAQEPGFAQNPVLAFNHLLHTYTPFSPYSESERKGLEHQAQFRSKGTGYSVEQSTQPQTLGYSLADSPAGLLAWIYEKLVHWTDKYQWDDDEVLTWVSIYWFSRAGPTASTRIYYETHQAKDLIDQPKVQGVPMGVSYFPVELFHAPKSWMHTVGEVVFCTEHSSGGHFAAYEKPDILAGDLRRMFGRGGPAFGVVPGQTGYAA
ncbi:alpha/beta-hydrolase [Heliocybe sulcata]|uniref:Alpha/beta-hydrolase n=1 Tax=Heliocybe sulcata TaxID=5364 RepID=A0A5C3N5J2_9AGAM|nr:alpha/beta-hydrolase [Heliocybe sulcata]